jgi:hypothetical protein
MHFDRTKLHVKYAMPSIHDFVSTELGKIKSQVKNENDTTFEKVSGVHVETYEQ